MRLLILEMDLCTGCKSCVVACSLASFKVFDEDRSHIKILREESRGLSVPLTCEQCRNPPCARACPVGAIIRNHDLGLVRISLEKCTGCGSCRRVCPISSDVITVIERKAYKCELCDGDPECVKACTTGAITFIESNAINLNRKMELAEQRVKTASSLRIRRSV